MNELHMTEDQMMTVKLLTDYAMNSAKVICDAMKEYGLADDLQQNMWIYISPYLPRIAVSFGDSSKRENGGYLKVSKSFDNWESDKYDVDSESSYEYGVLFANAEQKQRILSLLQREKELPPDGMWVADCDDSAFLDCGDSVKDDLADS